MMEALNLLLFILVLQAARAVVLAIWMIVLLIRGGVGRMVDFLLTRFENEVEVPPYEVKLPPVERLQRDRRVHWGRYDGGSIRPENAGLLFFGPVTCVHTRLRTPVEDVPLLHTSKDDEARAMKEGAAEVDAYWQRVREGGKDCLAAFSYGVSRIGRLAARVVVLIISLILDGVARMIDFLQTRVTSLARAMKEGAAEVDAYWQRVREGGENCHTASS